MKKLLLVCLVPLVFVGCGDAPDGYRMVREMFPKAEITTVPNKKFSFIIRDTNGAVYFMYSDGFTQSTSSESYVELFNPLK